MERYSEYKDSGVKWLGEIPSHWELRKIFGLFSENKRKNTAFLYKHAMQFNYGTIVDKNECFDTEETKEIYSNYSLINKGDIVINGLNLNYDFVSQRVAISPKNGIITSAYVVISPKVEINTYFYCYLFKNMDNMKIFHGMGTGVRKTLSYKELRNHDVLLPPLSEQDAIVRYLDTATSEIDKAIAMQQKMIDLLNERKQIIIQNAVTKGLDENVEMKESGVEWIGRIPKHWEVNPLRKYLKVCSKRNMPDAQLLSVTREEGVIVRNIESKEENHNYIPDDLSNYKYVQKGQFVINKMKSWQGSYGVSNYDGIVSPAYFVYDLMYYNKEYFSLAIRSKKFSPFFSKYSKGIRIDQWDLMPEALKIIPFLEPPVEEQNAIVHFLEDIIPRINDNITNCQRQITLLQERKQIIINEVVTGKVRVS